MIFCICGLCVAFSVCTYGFIKESESCAVYSLPAAAIMLFSDLWNVIIALIISVVLAVIMLKIYQSTRSKNIDPQIDTNIAEKEQKTVDMVNNTNETNDLAANENIIEIKLTKEQEEVINYFASKHNLSVEEYAYKLVIGKISNKPTFNALKELDNDLKISLEQYKEYSRACEIIKGKYIGYLQKKLKEAGIEYVEIQ